MLIFIFSSKHVIFDIKKMSLHCRKISYRLFFTFSRLIHFATDKMVKISKCSLLCFLSWERSKKTRYTEKGSPFLPDWYGRTVKSFFFCISLLIFFIFYLQQLRYTFIGREVEVRRYSTRTTRSQETKVSRCSRLQIVASPRKTRSQIEHSSRKTRPSKNEAAKDFSYEPLKFCSDTSTPSTDTRLSREPRKVCSEASNRPTHVRLTHEQKNRLEEFFRENRYPDSDEKEILANEFNVDYDRVR